MPATPYRFARLFVLLFALPLLGACATSAPAPKPKAAAPVAAGSTEPIRFGELAVSSMRRGMEIGRYIWDIDCAPPYDPVYWTSGWNLRRGSTFDERFDEVLTDAGFDVVGRLGGPDLPTGGMGRAAFIVQGDLRDVRVELCNRTNWLTGGKIGISGTGSTRVDWTIYDARNGRLVHKLTTSGAAKLDRGVPQGDVLLIEESFADAAERLAGDAGFRAAVSRSGATAARPPIPTPIPTATTLPQQAAAPPASAPPSSAPPPAGPIPLTVPADPQTAVPPLVPPSPIRLPAAAPGPSFRPGTGGTATEATVRVGQGRGVVIGEMDGQSVILTAAAVADATVAVHPARGVTLAGTVTARDPASGLALVQVPARLSALSLRGTPAQVSEPVALPAGRGKGKEVGIVGSVRPDPRTGLDAIQADLPGLATADMPAPGDPLTDAGGALLGLALGTRQPGAPAGLVAFHPVGQVLERMGVSAADAPAPTPAATAGPRRNWSSAPSLRDGMRDGMRAGTQPYLDEGDDPPT